MRDLIADGSPTSAAAATLQAAISTPTGQMVKAIVDAARHLDRGSIRALLDYAHALHGLPAAIDHVLLPAMRLVGEWWVTDPSSGIAQEHLATATVQAWLHARQGEPVMPPDPHPTILTCGPDELHTIGLQSLGALLAHQGVDCRILGAQTPTSALVATIKELNAAAAVVVSHHSQGRKTAVETICAAAKTPVSVYYAGASFDTAGTRAGLPGTYLGKDLTAATTQLAHRRHSVSNNPAFHSSEG